VAEGEDLKPGLKIMAGVVVLLPTLLASTPRGLLSKAKRGNHE
jgi:hypothetical protein